MNIIIEFSRFELIQAPSLILIRQLRNFEPNLPQKPFLGKFGPKLQIPNQKQKI